MPKDRGTSTPIFTLSQAIFGTWDKRPLQTTANRLPATVCCCPKKPWDNVGHAGQVGLSHCPILFRGGTSGTSCPTPFATAPIFGEIKGMPKLDEPLPSAEDVALWLTQCRAWIAELAQREAWPPSLLAEIELRLSRRQRSACPRRSNTSGNASTKHASAPATANLLRAPNGRHRSALRQRSRDGAGNGKQERPPKS